MGQTKADARIDARRMEGWCEVPEGTIPIVRSRDNWKPLVPIAALVAMNKKMRLLTTARITKL